MVAAIDWGVDVDSAAFRWPEDPPAIDADHEAGATRFLSFWDQRDQAVGPRPEPYWYGTVHTREEIDRALQDVRPYERLGYHPAIADPRGRGTHGTRTLDIAAGNGEAGGPAGIAPGADLIFVHLADRNTGGLANFGDSVRLLEAVNFISRTAGSQPCVINISAGRICGPKDGTTLVERAFDELLTTTPGRFVVNSAGNYFRWRAHSCGTIAPGGAHSLTFVSDPADISVNELEIWYDGADEFAVRIDPPGYAGGRPVGLGERSDLLIGGRVAGRVYHRKHDPNNGDNHIVAFLNPIGCAGHWTVTLEARRVSSGRFHAWIERDDSCPDCQARFTQDDSSPATTIGSIATSHLPLIVGAYDGHDPARPVATFSSAGPGRDGRDKPDLVAPGVGVLAARSAPVGASRNPGLLVRGNGTSFATPHVTGAVALCFEAAGSRLGAHEIRSLVLGSCDPVPDADPQCRLGRGYLNISRLAADVQQALAAPATTLSAKEPTMDTEDAIALLAAAPATAYREYLYRPRGQLARRIDDRYDVVAGPGQAISQTLRDGDVLLEVALGQMGSGRCVTLTAHDLQLMASRERLAPGQLLLRPRGRVEMSEPLPVEPIITQSPEEETRPLRDDMFAPLGGGDQEWGAETEVESPDPSVAEAEVKTEAEGETEAVAPPQRYAAMPLGVDLSDYQAAGQGKRRIPQPVATFQRLAHLGKVFAIIKSSQWQAEWTFHAQYENARAAGLVRGSYHFFTPRPVTEQVRLVLGLIPRVGPEELAPALDVEDPEKKPWLWEHYQYTHAGRGTAAGSAALLGDLQDWLDQVEAALGRTPIVYTGVMWRDDLRSTQMSRYPLWTLPGRLPMGGWRRAELLQYASDGDPWFGMQHYRETGVELPGVDYDMYNGTIYGLRGLADLGRVGVGLTPLGVVVARGETDQHIHLARESPPGTWTDLDLMRGSLPGQGGDPVLSASGTTVRLYFRSQRRVIEATQATPSGTWDVEDLSSVAGATAFHDPRVLTFDDRRVVVFSGDDDDWHLLSRTASDPWIVTHLLSAARRSGGTSVPPSSGQPMVYLASGSADLRVVGRAGPMGHMVELALGPSGWAATDLTVTAIGPHGIPPAATYSPAVYQSQTETFIVYRAIHGELWQIARNARRATNLTAASGIEPAVGHPTCFVLAGRVHVIYRGVDQGIHELTLRNGSWIAARLPCEVPAASDPTCTADASAGQVAFRAMDGMVHVLRFDGYGWTCADTIRSAVPVAAAPAQPPAPVPPAAGSSLFAALGAAAGRFRELVAAGDERSAVSLAYQHHQLDLNAITDLVFFARHRELGERRLRPGETTLAQEWGTIRERVVGPAVNALAQNDPAARPAAGHADEAEGEPGAGQPEPTGGSWLRAMTAAEAGFGEGADGPHGGGIGSIIGDVVKTVGGVATGAVDVLARAAAAEFHNFIDRLDELEGMALADGYNLTQRVTAFRKVFYGSFNPCGVPVKAGGSPYPGVPGGGAWDILIPGAVATPLPPSWTATAGAEKVTALCKSSWQVINGVPVHVGHVFTGLDARNYPTRITLSVLGFPLVQMRSNLEAATFTGDLGSVVVEYVHGSNRSARDTAMDLDPALLAATYNKDAGSDMTGNADAHLVVLNPSRTIVQNLCAYYTAPVGGWRRRWQGFVVTIGLGSFTPVPPTMPEPYRSQIVGTFSGLTEQWRSEMQSEIMEAALAYAAAKGHRGDVVAALADPKPGLFTITFWEIYWKVSGWVLDEFLHRLKRAVAAEP